MSHPLADDETRVILSLLQEEGHGDYINANFIRVRLVTREEVPLGGGEGGLQNLVNERAFPQGTDGSQAYIATQGPLPHTLLDFWRLVWEFGVKVSFEGQRGVVLSLPLSCFSLPMASLSLAPSSR